MKKPTESPPAVLPRGLSALSRVLALLLLAMVLLTFFNVVARYAFQRVWIPLQELVIYAHATVFMLGVLLAWRLGRHVRVDVFQQRFSPRLKRRVEAFGRWLLLLPFLIFMLAVSFDYVRESWQRLEGSAETGGLPAVFLLKSLLLVMPLVFALLLLGEAWRRRQTADQAGPAQAGN